MSAPRWVARQTVEILHDEQIAEHGGASGIRDSGLLESALMRPLNAWSYGETDLHQIAALYAEGIVRNHPFVDGNKRTGFLAAYTFLGLNGLHLRAPEDEAVEKTLDLAAGTLPREEFAAWLRQRSVPG
ncbi:MAG TPA: type II toxin-antitoxin system death-on-curing family toxin [Paracoccaceae bacterium]|nr:type II toxin-antitoxin system death-on-curing family toxin [Paracoccaceae bacterium]